MKQRQFYNECLGIGTEISSQGLSGNDGSIKEECNR